LQLADDAVTTEKIEDGAVTYAKIQNVSATDRLLGRATAGAGIIEEIPLTAFGRSLIDDVDAAAARTTLRVDAAGTDNSTDVTLAGEDYLTLDGQEITAGKIEKDHIDQTDGGVGVWDTDGTDVFRETGDVGIGT